MLINLNAKDALYLAALAATEEDKPECRELAEQSYQFFMNCNINFIDSYVWDAESLMALIKVAYKEEE